MKPVTIGSICQTIWNAMEVGEEITCKQLSVMVPEDPDFVSDLNLPNMMKRLQKHVSAYLSNNVRHGIAKRTLRLGKKVDYTFYFKIKDHEFKRKNKKPIEPKPIIKDQIALSDLGQAVVDEIFRLKKYVVELERKNGEIWRDYNSILDEKIHLEKMLQTEREKKCKEETLTFSEIINGRRM